VTQRQYESGASVQVARGHRPREHAYTRTRAEILPLLEGLPQQAQLERKLRNRNIAPESVEALALATLNAMSDWRALGGEQAVDAGPVAEDLGDKYAAIYDEWDWPDDERDVPEWYHGEGS
jgi:hypothetical protein